MYRLPIYKVHLVRDGSQQSEVKVISKPADVKDILEVFLAGADRENFAVVMLNTNNQVIGLNTVSVGTLNSCSVHPREVFKPLILANAAGVILGHNHPNGEPTPSKDDKIVTKILQLAGEILQIIILDHIIIGSEGRYYSFKDNGIL